MPFKSKAQRRKFAELLVEGKITPETYEEWNRDTGGAHLPERVKRTKSTKGAKSKRGTKATKATKSTRGTKRRKAAGRKRVRTATKQGARARRAGKARKR